MIGQRLIKKLCTSCRSERKATPSETVAFGLTEDEIIANSQGCSTCHQTGYNGRVAIMEILSLDDRLRQYLLKNGNLEGCDKVVDDVNLKPYEIKDSITSLKTSAEEITSQLNVI